MFPNKFLKIIIKFVLNIRILWSIFNSCFSMWNNKYVNFDSINHNLRSGNQNSQGDSSQDELSGGPPFQNALWRAWKYFFFRKTKIFSPLLIQKFWNEIKYLETKSLDSVGDTFTDGESIMTLDEPDGPLRHRKI